VFVSFSTIDNEVLVGDDRGWVDVLLDKLRRELKPRLGGRDLNIFMDHELMASNLPLTSQLMDAVRSSATLLVVMSPSYLKSRWCDQERRAFLDAVKERDERGALLVVRARPVEIDDQPVEFRELRGIDFFGPAKGAANHRLLGDPNPSEPLFHDRIVALSGDLAAQLHRSRAVPRTGKRVFVATATDDLDDREVELRRYLDQAGIEVLPWPKAQYPTTALAAYEDAVLRELETCSLFAQVLSPVNGKDLAFAPGHRLPSVQHALARRAGLPVLQWRERDRPIDGVRDPEHRALLDRAQACGIEEFKRTVVERALRPPATPPPTPPPAQVTIFVNADARDHKLAEEVSNALVDLDADCFYIPSTGSPGEIRVALEKNLRDCDGLVLVYGRTEFHWVQEQLRQARKLSSQRNPPLSSMAVVDGPPSEKPEISVRMRNLAVLPCRDGLDHDKLRRFVDQLRVR
ncbi:MAG TPA: toll/interleukin-1 receptor domain-containing protein, partial [Kofleriaceae bacterium]|nr:toll/interleukin-1 receptor domain-containing protein [Kofleriaceae bacterium]